MASTRIATTRLQDLRQLGTAGQTAVEAWSALVSLLARALSADHARLLAEPVANPARGEIDWYAEGDGPAVPLAQLPEPRQGELRRTWHRLRDEIGALAASMRSSREDGQRVFADMLSIATVVPDDSYIRVRGDAIVLVAWGHRLAGATVAAAPVDLTGAATPPLRPMAILPPPGLPAATPLRGVRLASLLALLLLLLAAYITLRDPFGWSAVQVAACGVAPGELALRDQLRSETDRGATLRAQLAALADDAGQRRLQCAPVQQAAAPPPSSDVQRAQQRGAQSGKLQIILAWDDRNDLDIFVQCPDGRNFIGYDYRSYPPFGHKEACGGSRDIDANGSVATTTATPVENVSFADPAPGIYRIRVYPFKWVVSTSSPFRVTIKKDGQPDQVISGTASGSGFEDVVSVTMP